ncbi:hypothetical protein A0U90_13905 (plasmid) [Kozakia baliensis]|nr:hypothetical protein A0U90_13905 [Kozakia baliensis]
MVVARPAERGPASGGRRRGHEMTWEERLKGGHLRRMAWLFLAVNLLPTRELIGSRGGRGGRIEKKTEFEAKVVLR